MNNLLSYRDYLNNHFEELNEGDGIIRKVFNKSIQKHVKAKLSEEIEMSKQIMDGVKTGLESLNDNFDKIKEGIENDDENVKGEKQKLLDEITKILEKSRKTTWDLNELIDEGEIDYAGFTANAGISTVALFGVLLSPIRTSFILHKGYNYFFAIIKNTIRKALVMLQLNFDQFENLIVTKSFQSEDYLRDNNVDQEIGEFYGNLCSQLFDDKHGSMKNKRGSKSMEQALRAAKDKFDLQMRAAKQAQSSRNVYDCLDQYNNTYTKSLESLRSYSQDDVQKQLDGIKSSMTKIAAGDTDLSAYGELICAAAEEHAYKVSSAIYSKFAKMTEVFSLPNQKKMIDLIQEATEEREKDAEKRRKKELSDKEAEDKMNEITELNQDGEEIFKSVSGSELGELDNDNKYKDVVAKNWTYDEYKKLNSEKREKFEQWLAVHPEVLKKCKDTLKVVIINSDNDGYFKYVDSLVDYVRPALKHTINDSLVVKNFNDYIINEAKDESKYYIDFSKIEDHIKSSIKNDYSVYDDVAQAALESIGNNILKNSAFSEKTVKSIITAIVSAEKDGKKEISHTLYEIIDDATKELKEQRSHDYPVLNGSGDGTKKSED